jgi:hypothetical protein
MVASQIIVASRLNRALVTAESAQGAINPATTLKRSLDNSNGPVLSKERLERMAFCRWLEFALHSFRRLRGAWTSHCLV